MIREPILVTGGAGFLGCRLVRRLAEEGADVRVLDPDAMRVTFPGDVRRIEGSVTNRQLVREAMEGVATVFHLAAHAGLWAADPTVFERVNHMGTLVVLEAAQEAGVDRFIHTASEVILRGWNDPDPTPINEETIAPPLTTMAGPYSRSKWRADQAVRQAIEAGVPAIILYPAVPVGPDDRRRTPPTRMLEGFLYDPPPAYLDCSLNLLAIEDIVEAHLLAAERGRDGRRYILGSPPVAMSDLLHVIGEVAKRPMPRHRIPFPIALAAGRLAEWQASRNEVVPTATIEGVRLARYPRRLDASRASEELGWRWRDPLTAVRETIETWIAARHQPATDVK